MEIYELSGVELQNAISWFNVSSSPGPSDSIFSQSSRFDSLLATMGGQDGGGAAQSPDGSLIWDLSEQKFAIYSSASIDLNKTFVLSKLLSGPRNVL